MAVLNLSTESDALLRTTVLSGTKRGGISFHFGWGRMNAKLAQILLSSKGFFTCFFPIGKPLILGIRTEDTG
jgi:hypothetical protein